ncbi:hypothetical protein SAMN02910435_01126 [Ruminococcaceae bacterium D5]|nr:hypothetical protein SAMN02910435_01126 [Ruminococcaceae bacterium D5]
MNANEVKAGQAAGAAPAVGIYEGGRNPAPLRSLDDLPAPIRIFPACWGMSPRDFGRLAPGGKPLPGKH